MGKVYEERNRRGAIWQKHFVEKIVIYVRRNCRKNAEDAKKGQAGVLAVTDPIADCCRGKISRKLRYLSGSHELYKTTAERSDAANTHCRSGGKRRKRSSKKRKSKGTGKMAVAFVLGSSFPISLRGLCLTKA